MSLFSYARVSRDDPPGVERIAVQHRDNRAKIAELGEVCAGELEDDGISGYLDERWRPGLNALLESWKAGESHGSVARDSERYARNAMLMGHIWTISRQASARVISRREDLEDRITRNAAGQGGEAYRESVRANCLAKFALRAQEHLYPGGPAGFGIRWVRTVDDTTALQMRLRHQPIPYRREIEPDEAARLVRAVEIVESGGSIRAAATAIGISEMRLSRALRNPTIAGAHVYGRTRTIPDTPLRTTEGATPLIDWGAHEAIITQARWDRLQERLAGITAAYGWAARPGRLSVPLSGQLLCGVCGERVEIYAGPMPKKHRYRYCRCASAARCVHAEVSRWPRPILAAVATHLADPKMAAAFARAHARGQQPGAVRSTASASARLRRREATILDLASDGTISAEEARRRLAPIRAEAEALRTSVPRNRESSRWLSADEIHAGFLRAAEKLKAGTGDDEDLRKRLIWALRSVRITGPRNALLELAWGEILPTSLASTDSSVDAYPVGVIPWELTVA